MDENKPQINNRENLKTVRTYLSDMADTVRENEISVIKVALAEQNKHEREDLYRQIEGTPTKKIFWFISGIVLIGISIFGTYYIIQKKAENNIIQVTPQEESIISFDNAFTLEITDSENLINKIKNQIKEIKNANNVTPGITSISIKKEVNTLKEKLSISEIFSKMELAAPSSLIRSLSDQYMIGVYNKSNIFLIFKSKDYEYTYAGMLEWENTLASDMSNIFELKTNENKLELNERKWKDVIINNRDARVLYNKEGLPILYYIFADKDNLVITDNEDVIKEIISRLVIKNIKPL